MNPQLFLIANLSLDEPGYQKWRKLKLDGSKLQWLDGEPIFNGEEPAIAKSVGELLDRLGEIEAIDGNSFIELGRADGTLSLVGALVGDEAIITWHHALGTACRLAGKVGGSGELIAMVAPLGFGAQIMVGTPDEIYIVDHDELGELFRPHTATVSMISSWLLARANDPGVDRDEFFRYARSLGLGELSAAPVQQRMLRELARFSPEELFEAASRVVAANQTGSLAEHFGSAESLAAALEQADKVLRAQGIEILAELAPTVAEPVAFELLEDSSSYVREAAMRSMGRYTSGRALDCMLELRDRLDAMGMAQLEAVALSTHPDLEQRLTRLAHDEVLFDEESYRAIDDPGAVEAELEECDRIYRRAFQVLSMVQRRGMQALAPRLVELFLDPPVRAMREPLALALETIGGPDVEAIAAKIHHFRFGMGLALNQDDERRRELLDIRPSVVDDGGIMHFEDLTLERLRHLLEEQFIDPDARQNEAPSTIEFYQFMEEWPEVTAHGYAVSIERDDYRIHIEGLDCDLADVDEDRREELKEAFEELCGEATEYEADDEGLYAWWT